MQDDGMPHALRMCYRNWEQSFPTTLQWRKTKASSDDSWWNIAAGVARSENLPASLLIYIVAMHLNGRPEDAEVPLSPNVYRSESLIIRSVANFRRRMSYMATTLEPIHQLETGEKLKPDKSTVQYIRKLAMLSIKYFKHSLEFATYPLRKMNQETDLMHDLLAYKMCDTHPFLLLGVAKTQRVRALAAVNCWALCGAQPWNTVVWEGIASPYSLSTPDQMAGCDVNQYFEKPGWYWPAQLMREDKWNSFPIPLPSPTLLLTQFNRCHNTDLFLALKLEAASTGGEAPTCGW